MLERPDRVALLAVLMAVALGLLAAGTGKAATADPAARSAKVDRKYFTADLGARTLKRGMRGRDVRTLQRLLALKPDGAFGRGTARAVRRFQRDAGVKADGRVGRATRQALAGRRMGRKMATWYGPGLFGNRTACGQTLTRSLRGVAHRTLPCGTPVVLELDGRFLTVPVVDRGPFTAGFVLDITAGAAKVLRFGGSRPVRARYAR